MKRVFKWTGVIVLILVAGVAIATACLQNRQFDAPYPNIGATTDIAVIARGRTLVYGAAHCANCHAPAAKEAEVDKGIETPLSGGIVFDIPIGKIYAKNITPDATGIGNISDAAIARALRYGVSSNGKALFDFMPFHHTSDEDLAAIISYLRSQPAVHNPVPANELNILGKVLNAFLLKPAGPTEEVPAAVKKDTGAMYGKYLANSIANCRGCHTKRDLMTGAFTGKNYAGGLQFESTTDSGIYVLTTPNLTPDKATGRISRWSQEQFIDRFRKGKIYPASHMPWGQFGRMSDEELKAVYNYLQTVQPVKNAIPVGPVKK